MGNQGKKKHNTKTHIKKELKKKKRTINLNQRYKKEQKSTERERESTHILLGEKYGLDEENDIKFIQNEMGRRRVKI